MLLSLWNKKNPKTRPEIILWNAPVNNKKEKGFITQGLNSNHFLPLLTAGAKTLEKSGADFLVLPCNSLHIHIARVRKSVKIPVISVLEIVHNNLLKNGITGIGILGNSATVKTHLFDKTFAKTGIKITFPANADQKELNKIIHHLVTNENTEKDSAGFARIVKELKKQGANDILLACTDLRLLNPRVKGVTFIDTLELLASATVEKMMQE